MQCEFSEFSYGYAAVREAESELAGMYKQSGAPTLPSLVEEATVGYDAKVPLVRYALFLQFKRSEYISRGHPDSPTWWHFGAPHYRFQIDVSGHQHRELRVLETRLGTSFPGDVLYAAPMFYRQSEFDTAYLGGHVLDRTMLVAPSAFDGLTGVHRFAHDGMGVRSILSEPRVPNRSPPWQVVLDQERSRAASVDNDRRRVPLSELEDVLVSAVAETGRDIVRDLGASVTRRVHRLAGLMGCGLLLFVDPAS